MGEGLNRSETKVVFEKGRIKVLMKGGTVSFRRLKDGRVQVVSFGIPTANLDDIERAFITVIRELRGK